jgi:hypothetical protein
MLHSAAVYLPRTETVPWTSRPERAVVVVQNVSASEEFMKHHNRITPAQPGHDPSLNQTVLSRLAALKAMSVKDLKAEWEKLLGTSAPNNSRAFLELRIAYRLQELTYGGPDRETRRMLDLLADEVEGHARRKHQIADPRNPVTGTKLLREWDGVEHTVTVLKHGFDWRGRKFKSLSAVAREITGTRWNGYRFFGLRERKREEA